MSKSSVDLSIIVTAHSEGILLHKTLASIKRACKLLDENRVNWELLIHADNPTPNMESYLTAHAKLLKNFTIYRNNFGDLGSSRNFAVGKASGKYVTFIDADDLMSERWLIDAYRFLERHTLGEYIAHTELTVEFGASDSVVRKYGETDKTTDTLLSVFANRWNSIIMLPRVLALEEPYAPNSPGYGYEDWHLNCRFINRGIHNILIPETVIFVRRKDLNSEWLRQKQSRAVLHMNPLFAFENIRSLQLDNSESSTTFSQPETRNQKIKRIVKPLASKLPGSERYVRKLYQLAQSTRRSVASESSHESVIPQWLILEWESIHVIEKQLFPTSHLIAHVPIYESLTPDHYATGAAFKQLIDQTHYNKYDYIFFVPWLIHGGADLFTINYANTIRKLRKNVNILVIATLPSDSPRSGDLGEGVDFIQFGNITKDLSVDIKQRLLEQLVENSQAQYLHIINSELGYDFVSSHSTYIAASNKRIIATSFSQSTDQTRRVFGYSHTHVPKIYDLLDVITTDNQAVADMWVNEYGFDPRKIIVHHQPVTIPDQPEHQDAASLRVLWAARLAPEKQPNIIGQIGSLINSDVTIDMYGTPDQSYDTAFLQSLPENVTYRGAFSNFYDLPLGSYDLYLYTSLFDGMPNALLEAASVRLPIISSAVGGIPEFISNNKSGVLIEDITNAQSYADAINTLDTDRKKLTTFANNQFTALSERFSWMTFEKDVEVFLKKVGM